MKSLLSEAEESVEIEMKAALPQLILAMDAMGLDPQNDEHQEQFVAMLKKLVTNKSKLMSAMKMFSASKAKKALKAAKASV
jgi:hypothetical protein